VKLNGHLKKLFFLISAFTFKLLFLSSTASP